MLIPDASGCEAFLGVLGDILRDLPLEQIGIEEASVSLKASMRAVFRVATSIW